MTDPMKQIAEAVADMALYAAATTQGVTESLRQQARESLFKLANSMRALAAGDATGGDADERDAGSPSSVDSEGAAPTGGSGGHGGEGGETCGMCIEWVWREEQCTSPGHGSMGWCRERGEKVCESASRGCWNRKSVPETDSACALDIPERTCITCSWLRNDHDSDRCGRPPEMPDVCVAKGWRYWRARTHPAPVPDETDLVSPPEPFACSDPAPVPVPVACPLAEEMESLRGECVLPQVVEKWASQVRALAEERDEWKRRFEQTEPPPPGGRTLAQYIADEHVPGPGDTALAEECPHWTRTDSPCGTTPWCCLMGHECYYQPGDRRTCKARALAGERDEAYRTHYASCARNAELIAERDEAVERAGRLGHLINRLQRVLGSKNRAHARFRAQTCGIEWKQRAETAEEQVVLAEDTIAAVHGILTGEPDMPIIDAAHGMFRNMKIWKQRAETAEKRVAELESLLASQTVEARSARHALTPIPRREDETWAEAVLRVLQEAQRARWDLTEAQKHVTELEEVDAECRYQRGRAEEYAIELDTLRPRVTELEIANDALCQCADVAEERIAELEARLARAVWVLPDVPPGFDSWPDWLRRHHCESYGHGGWGPLMRLADSIEQARKPGPVEVEGWDTEALRFELRRAQDRMRAAGYTEIDTEDRCHEALRAIARALDGAQTQPGVLVTREAWEKARKLAPEWAPFQVCDSPFGEVRPSEFRSALGIPEEWAQTQKDGSDEDAARSDNGD